MNAPGKKYGNIDEYIALFPETAREKLSQIRQIIREEAPGAVETISYQMPAFKLNGRILVYFAAFKDHVSFFPTSSGVTAFEKELSAYTTSKGTIQFPLDKKIPVGLIKRIVKYKVKENIGK